MSLLSWSADADGPILRGRPGALLQFPPDVGLRARLFPPAARRHPGKLHLGFLAWLATEYGLAGQTILDPMAGGGGLLYLTLAPWGCRVVLHELERQWCHAAAEAWAQMQARQFDVVGMAAIVQGDARQLRANLCGAPDAIVFSPPYGDALGQGRIGAGLQRYLADNANGTGHGPSSLLRAEPTYDAIITSPPYAEALNQSVAGQAREERAIAKYGWSARRSMIRGAAYDAVVTSPPYADALTHQRHQHDYGPDAAPAQQLRVGYDAPTDGTPPPPGVRNPAQIGNLGGARYQTAMAAVYAECAAVLRPGGLCIVVIKNIIRKRQEVDLVSQATEQLAGLGLAHVATHWRETGIGPFHNIRRKSDPTAPIVTQEAAIVLRKPGGAA